MPSQHPPSSSARLEDLPTELHIEIFTSFANYRDAVALSLTCRYLNSVYKDNEDSILTTLAKRLVAPIASFYDFLARLCLPAERVLHPFPSGWTNITPQTCSGFDKSRFALTVLKHLSYVSSDNENFTEVDGIGYNLYPINYSRFATEDFATFPWDLSELVSRSDELWGRRFYHNFMLEIADNEGDLEAQLVLDTFTGIVYEKTPRTAPSHHHAHNSLAEYCKDRIESCTSLQEVFVPGSQNMFGPLEDYDAEEMNRQGEPVPIMEPDPDAPYGDPIYDDALNERKKLQWVRHLYRKHGWPGEGYDKEGCLEELEQFVERWEEYDP